MSTKPTNATTEPTEEPLRLAENNGPVSAPSAPTPAGPRPMSELEVLIRARYPLLYVTTWEEPRLIAQVNRIAAQLGKKVYEWSITTGLVPTGTVLEKQKQRDTASQDPLVALDNVIEQVEPAIYVFKDFHPFIKCGNMSVIRRMREIAAFLKNTYKTIIIVSPMFEMPPELEKDLTVIDLDLPGPPEFARLLERVVREVKDNPKLDVNVAADVREQIVHALLGLTLAEAENVLAKTLVQNRSLNEKSIDVIRAEKKQIIRKSGLLEFYDTRETENSVGGLDELRRWLTRRAVAFTDRARAVGLPAPRGVLLLGVQGCGKSLMAKVVSNIWQLPLLRFDVGRLFSSLVGSSEDNARRAIKVAESISPAVLWVDEIDKAFRGSRSSSAATDGGTSARVFGTFLTWLSEKTRPVFVVATANDVSALPPELLRKGRFDEIFFVDLPLPAERREILAVHLAKRNLDVAAFDLEALAAATPGFSGAEIEEAVVAALFEAFAAQKPLDTPILIEAIKQTVPLSRTMAESMDTLRQWAEGRARRATSAAYVQKAGGDQRKLEI